MTSSIGQESVDHLQQQPRQVSQTFVPNHPETITATGSTVYHNKNQSRKPITNAQQFHKPAHDEHEDPSK